MMTGGRKRLNDLYPERLHNLGAWGPTYNCVAIFFVIQAIVIYCFPATIPVTAGSMNYGEHSQQKSSSSAVVVFILL